MPKVINDSIIYLAYIVDSQSFQVFKSNLIISKKNMIPVKS